MLKSKIKIRCHWVNDDPLYIRYHDKEWGVPVHKDRTLFEFLTLEGAQAGLSWITILKRREGYRKAFSGFDPQKVAKFTARKQKRLLRDPGIIRHKLKIQAAVTNAQAFLAVQKEFKTFDRYIWSFSDEKAMSKDLKKRGFRFVGPTICYAFMQACGLVNDHDRECFRRGRLKPQKARTQALLTYS